MKEIKINHPNFLGSEKCLITKTVGLDNSTSYVTENGRQIVKAGTVVTSPYYGLVFQDVDVTNGQVPAPVMIAGYYIDAKLPSTAASYVTNFAAQGLFPITEGQVVRPNFGSSDLTKLETPTVTASQATITITKVNNAVQYAIYKSATSSGTYTYIADVAQSDNAITYTATANAYYKVKAIGDNLNYKDSELSSAVQVSSIV